MLKIFTLSILVFLIFLYRDEETYICGYASAVTLSSALPATSPNTNVQATIENFYYKFGKRYIGTNPNSIDIKEGIIDGEGLRYAAAGYVKLEGGEIRRYISYDPKMFTDAFIKAENGWLYRSIILHEIGHHLSADNLRKEKTAIAERYADEFSGLQMANAGVSLDVAIKAVSTLTDLNPGGGYPSRKERIDFVTTGWRNGQEDTKEYMYTAFAKTKIKSPGNGMFGNAIKDFKNISMAVENSALETIKYHNKNDKSVNLQTAGSLAHSFSIDNDYLYYKSGDQLTQVGRVAPSNSPAFKLMIIDKFFNFMYVNEKNQLVVFDYLELNKDKSDKFLIVGTISTN
ncbi:hypothetical protein [Pedobacter roseus]|uniref:Uncharacterized protein n=1 Tax=Pedobacter roseus TaxID=336820 RepID=A0A7G9QHV7_9SPHI|nr:hypothetical protein [Pedobacter roseus]QNN42932.1 hypothetical protein H9L23_02160 [Pedobacter roseus]